MGAVREQPQSEVLPLTVAGRQQVRSEVSLWKRYAAAVFKVIEPA